MNEPRPGDRARGSSSTAGADSQSATSRKGSGLAGADGLERARGYSDTQSSSVINNTAELILDDVTHRQHTAFAFSTKKKWTILTVIFIVQVSMNFNASVYGNAIQPLTERYSINAEEARYGQMAFLIAYAFGSELWAPWSEEYGRWIVLQLSLFFVNIWQIPCALAPNFQTVLAGRILGGLSSAGGSVTLGMVADMWGPETQQYAVAWVVLSSVGGSVVGPVAGGFIQQYLPLQWNFWIQLIFGVVVQVIHMFTPETRSSVMLDKVAKKERKEGRIHVRGPGDVAHEGLTIKKVLEIWYRPFMMFFTEPIVLCLSLLSGFSDALIFTFLEAYGPVYKQWGFGPIQTGLAFLAIGIGYVIAWLSFLPVIRHDLRVAKIYGNDYYSPERRLWWLLFTGPLLTIGLFIFAWTSLGPAYGIPWIAPMIASCLIGIANYAIYMATIDYMVAAYGEYSASATGGNALARDFLAGIAALYSTRMFETIGVSQGRNFPYASTILACIAFVVTVPIYIFYFKGEWFRARSKFAQDISQHRKEAENRVAHEKNGDV